MLGIDSSTRVRCGAYYLLPLVAQYASKACHLQQDLRFSRSQVTVQPKAVCSRLLTVQYPLYGRQSHDTASFRFLTTAVRMLNVMCFVLAVQMPCGKGYVAAHYQGPTVAPCGSLLAIPRCRAGGYGCGSSNGTHGGAMGSP